MWIAADEPETAKQEVIENYIRKEIEMHIATATAPGSAHTNPGQPGKINNQDALVMRKHPRGYVTVLCDGCGSQPYSGVGADIGANVIAQAVSKRLSADPKIERLDWSRITEEVIDALRKAAGIFAQSDSIADFERAVIDRFLFTAVILAVIEDKAVITSFGDGFIVLDDEVIAMDPPILNSPAYIGYLLLKKSAYHAPELRQHLAFQTVRTVELSKLEKGLIVGTDGLRDLVEEDLHHPALVQPKSLQRWINAQTTECMREGSFFGGKCKDDVSLVIVRSDQAQKKLVEDRREVVQLKQELSKLQSNVTSLTENLDLANAGRKNAEEKIGDLESQLAKAKAKARPPHTISKVRQAVTSWLGPEPTPVTD